jgi:hypothetical protein
MFIIWMILGATVGYGISCLTVANNKKFYGMGSGSQTERCITKVDEV